MHTCPDCGRACYCNGDIDDIEVDPSGEYFCSHCDDGKDEDGLDYNDDAD